MSTQAHDYEYHGFDAMGTRIGFWIDRSAGHHSALAMRTGATLIRDFDRRLTRFEPTSELCALNGDPAETVGVSSLMFRFLAAALGAAEATGGLVDPTLLDEIELAGYRASRVGIEPASLAEALARPRPVHPATADPAARWRSVSLDAESMTVSRPAGLRFDSGGAGKGLAADMVAQLWSQLLPENTPFIVDCGGDMRLGAIAEDSAAYEIHVDPVLGRAPEPFRVRGGGVATSGLGKRIWKDGEDFAHHLIDPGTGRPAWTGLVSVTALRSSAVEAETASKHALLLGDPSGHAVLAEHGGMTVDRYGNQTVINPERVEAFA